MIYSALQGAASTTPPNMSPPTDPWSLVQYGILGILVLCLLTRKFLVQEWVLRDAETRHQQELAAKDKRTETDLAAKDARIASLESQVERLQGVTISELIPALTRATQVAAEYNEERARDRHTREARRGAGDRS